MQEEHSNLKKPCCLVLLDDNLFLISGIMSFSLFLRISRAHNTTYMCINGIVRFHCDLIESRVITPGGLCERKLLTAGYIEVKPTFVCLHPPTRHTTQFQETMQRDTCTRRVTRPTDFLRLHFCIMDKKRLFAFFRNRRFTPRAYFPGCPMQAVEHTFSKSFHTKVILTQLI